MKNLRANSILVSATAAIAIACGAAFAGDDDERISKTLSLKDFERISVSGVYDLAIAVGGDYSIAIAGPADEVERIEVSVSNGELEFSQTERKGGWRRKQEGVDVAITLPMLRSLDVSGVVDGDIEGIDADTFDFDISGVGDIDIEGRCDTLTANVSGVGDLDADGLECRSVEISVSGVGDASVFASEEVDAIVSGMGDIDVYGKPERVSKSGSMFADITVH